MDSSFEDFQLPTAKPTVKRRAEFTDLFCSPEKNERLPLQSLEKNAAAVTKTPIDDNWLSSYSSKLSSNLGWTFKKLLSEVLIDRESTIQFLMEKDLLKKSQTCEKCGEDMKLVVDSGKKASSEGRIWTCRKTINGTRHQTCKSIRARSWYQNSNINLAETVQLTYFWCNKYRQEQVMHELGVSSNTAVDWYMFHREVCDSVIMSNSDKIGGPGKIVEIDESKFGKRKYHKGHHVEGQWVFGGVERGNRANMFMVPVDRRDAATLVPVIKEWIEPGTTIISDCWKAYDCLEHEDFVHLKVNHSMTFKDPETGAHTNSIEGAWNHAKKNMPMYGTKKAHFKSYLGEHMWRVRVKHLGMDPFSQFLKDLVETYDPETWSPPGN